MTQEMSTVLNFNMYDSSVSQTAKDKHQKRRDDGGNLKSLSSTRTAPDATSLSTTRLSNEYITMASLPQVDTVEKEWPVHFFRKTSRGWEQMQPRNGDGQLVAVKATPLAGCIVLRKLRVRVSLTTTTASTTTPQDKSSEAAVQETKSVMVRRRSSILITSNQGLKAILLKFRTEKDCLDFSDQFIALNPLDLCIGQANDDTGGGGGTGNLSQVNAGQQSQEVLFYIARLLHDPDFVNYVDSLESSLESSQDGAKILDVLTNTGVH